ncbi:hypothetical protein Dimus_022944 [Dionaea muscipula]
MEIHFLQPSSLSARRRRRSARRMLLPRLQISNVQMDSRVGSSTFHWSQSSGSTARLMQRGVATRSLLPSSPKLKGPMHTWDSTVHESAEQRRRISKAVPANQQSSAGESAEQRRRIDDNLASIGSESAAVLA